MNVITMVNTPKQDELHDNRSSLPSLHCHLSFDDNTLVAGLCIFNEKFDLRTKPCHIYKRIKSLTDLTPIRVNCEGKLRFQCGKYHHLNPYTEVHEPKTSKSFPNIIAADSITSHVDQETEHKDIQTRRPGDQYHRDQ